MFSKPEELINFLTSLTEIESLEYILFTGDNDLSVVKSSIPLVKFSKKWLSMSPLTDIISKDEMQILRHLALKGEGGYQLPFSVIRDLSLEIYSITAISFLKNSVALLFYLPSATKKMEINTPFITDIFFAFNVSSFQIDLISFNISDILGYSPHEITSVGIAEYKSLMHKDDIHVLESRVNSYTENPLRRNLPLNLEFRVRDVDNLYHYFIQKSIFSSKSRNPGYQVGILRDITEIRDPNLGLLVKNNYLKRLYHKQLELSDESLNTHHGIQGRELQDSTTDIAYSEEIFRQLAENTSDILWLRDNKDILYINDQFEIIWGRDKKLVFENPTILNQWIYPEDINNFEPWINPHKLTKGTPFVEQFRIVKPDGSIRWLSSRIFPIFNSDDEPYRILGIISDITEQKDFEDALRVAKEKAQESDLLKSTFLANISHEIRTPMNGIVGFAELLSREEIEPSTRKNYVSIMKKSSDQLIHIIDDIIDFAKIEANQIRVVQEKIEINRLLDQLNTVFNNQLLQKGVEDVKLIVVKPLQNNDSVIISDEHRLIQIMSYLIENSIKYTSKGSITIGYKKQDEKIEFYVTDTGIGIPEDKHEIIFERFRQVDEGNTRKFGGTGLGLPIAKGLVNLLGGNISVKSKPGDGSTFSFTIPLKLHVSTTPLKAQEYPETDLAYLNEKLILVAEDDELNYEYMRVLFDSTGAKLVRAKDGSQAVKICCNLKMDLILMDIRLPVLNGIQATRQLRAMGVKTPIIAQTAFAMDDDEQQCLDAGCNAYIAKPINRERLFSLIQKYIQSE